MVKLVGLFMMPVIASLSYPLEVMIGASALRKISSLPVQHKSGAVANDFAADDVVIGFGDFTRRKAHRSLCR